MCEVIKMKYKILQLRDLKKVDYAFMHYDYAKEHGLSLDDYDVIYEGEIETGRYIENTLESIFTKFNINRPEDFKGHSMSVSDIVMLGGEYWYTDFSGFKKLDRHDLLQ